MKKAIIYKLKPFVKNTNINLVIGGMTIRDLTNGISLDRTKEVIDYVNTFKLKVLNEETFNFSGEFWYNK